MDEIEFTSAVYGDAEKTYIKAVSYGKSLCFIIRMGKERWKYNF